MFGLFTFRPMPLELRGPPRASRRLVFRAPGEPSQTLPPSSRAERAPSTRRPGPFPPVVSSVPSTGPVLPIRLRYVALLIAAGLSMRSLGARGLAFWQLHGAASDFANYAACMAGPTGPELLGPRPEDFSRLVRRRLVAARPDSKPFAPCLPALDAYTRGARDARRAAHDAKAGDYVEYGALPGEGRASTSLASLTVDDSRLRELRDAAWPFAPAELGPLLRPERSAKVAPHPAEPPRPARGVGLPPFELGYSASRQAGRSELLLAGQGANASVYRSDDGGATWASVDVEEPALAAASGLCSSGDGRVGFRLRHTGTQLHVESWLAAARETSFPLADADARLTSFACDATAAVAVLQAEERKTSFRLCPHRTPCKVLPVPAPLRAATSEIAAVSIARVKGVSIIATTRAGVVRVISSRDDGETWTPSVVAHDRAEQQSAAGASPAHLLGLGSRVMLYAGAQRPSQAYPALFSSDFGASWQGQ